MRADKNNVRYIYGRYVNEPARDNLPVCTVGSAYARGREGSLFFVFEEEGISGTLGKNLVDITFSTKQVVDSDEHRLLMAMKTSSLEVMPLQGRSSSPGDTECKFLEDNILSSWRRIHMMCLIEVRTATSLTNRRMKFLHTLFAVSAR